MVLRPLYSPAAKAGKPAPPATAPASGAAALPPVWGLIAEAQKGAAAAYWLVSQPDHAALSGELAANFVSPHWPRLSPEVVRAIALHDSGWSVFPQEAVPGPQPALTAAGKPLAFTEYPPRDSVRAWTQSIERAEAVAAVGGLIVSRHFCGLGQFRLQNGCAEADQRIICAFLDREHGRQQRLAGACHGAPQEIDRLLEVLQFCDLLSLYLCCGVEQDAEFPQRLAGRPVQVRRWKSGESYRFDPSPFQAEDSAAGDALRTVSLGVTARYYPPNGEPKITTLPFLLC